MKAHGNILFWIIIIASPSHALHYDRFTQETVAVGGSALLPFKIDEHQTISLDLDIRPHIGYFVYPNFSLSMNILLASNLYYKSSLPNARPDLFKWGVEFVATYYFDWGWQHWVPYAGLGIGYEIVQLQWRTEAVSFGLPIGFLLPITKNLAIDFGFPMKFKLAPFKANLVGPFEMPIGCLGIRGFF
jgi:hypothetical protein